MSKFTQAIRRIFSGNQQKLLLGISQEIETKKQEYKDKGLAYNNNTRAQHIAAYMQDKQISNPKVAYEYLENIVLPLAKGAKQNTTDYFDFNDNVSLETLLSLLSHANLTTIIQVPFNPKTPLIDPLFQSYAAIIATTLERADLEERHMSLLTRLLKLPVRTGNGDETRTFPVMLIEQGQAKYFENLVLLFSHLYKHFFQSSTAIQYIHEILTSGEPSILKALMNSKNPDFASFYGQLYPMTFPIEEVQTPTRKMTQEEFAVQLQTIVAAKPQIEIEGFDARHINWASFLNDSRKNLGEATFQEYLTHSLQAISTNKADFILFLNTNNFLNIADMPEEAQTAGLMQEEDENAHTAGEITALSAVEVKFNDGKSLLSVNELLDGYVKYLKESPVNAQKNIEQEILNDDSVNFYEFWKQVESILGKIGAANSTLHTVDQKFVEDALFLRGNLQYLQLLTLTGILQTNIPAKDKLRMLKTAMDNMIKNGKHPLLEQTNTQVYLLTLAQIVHDPAISLDDIQPNIETWLKLTSTQNAQDQFKPSNIQPEILQLIIAMWQRPVANIQLDIMPLIMRAFPSKSYAGIMRNFMQSLFTEIKVAPINVGINIVTNLIEFLKLSLIPEKDSGITRKGYLTPQDCLVLLFDKELTQSLGEELFSKKEYAAIVTTFLKFISKRNEFKEDSEFGRYISTIAESRLNQVSKDLVIAELEGARKQITQFNQALATLLDEPISLTLQELDKYVARISSKATAPIQTYSSKAYYAENIRGQANAAVIAILQPILTIEVLTKTEKAEKIWHIFKAFGLDAADVNLETIRQFSNTVGQYHSNIDKTSILGQINKLPLADSLKILEVLQTYDATQPIRSPWIGLFYPNGQKASANWVDKIKNAYLAAQQEAFEPQIKKALEELKNINTKFDHEWIGFQTNDFLEKKETFLGLLDLIRQARNIIDKFAPLMSSQQKLSMQVEFDKIRHMDLSIDKFAHMFRNSIRDQLSKINKTLTEDTTPLANQQRHLLELLNIFSKLKEILPIKMQPAGLPETVNQTLLALSTASMQNAQKTLWICILAQHDLLEPQHQEALTAHFIHNLDRKVIEQNMPEWHRVNHSPAAKKMLEFILSASNNHDFLKNSFVQPNASASPVAAKTDVTNLPNHHLNLGGSSSH